MKASKLGKKLLWPCSIALLAILAGCAIFGSLADKGSTGAQEGETISVAERLLDEQYFPKDKVVDVKVTIDPDAFQQMLDNASAEELMEASVSYNGVQFDNVAIRTKGNLSLSSVVRMDDSDRYSFKISFDEYVNQTLGGISKVNLNNGYSDASYMREFLAYELAESLGLPTPKFSFVQLYVNDELKGLYLAIEQIGDAYLERHFGNATGALYKANGGTGSELNWLETIDQYTGLDSKQSKSDDEGLLHMLDVLNNGSDYDSVLNVDHALGYFALNVAGGNFDSYHSDKKHNYYLYGDGGLFSILPWDFNMAFGTFGSGDILIDEPTSGALADRPLIAKLLAVEAYKDAYHEKLRQVVDGYLSEEAFAARVAEVRQLIETQVQNDPTSFVTYEEFQQGVEQLLAYNTSNTAKIQEQLDGTAPSSGDGSGSGGGMGGGFGGGPGMGGFGGGGGFGDGMGRPDGNTAGQGAMMPPGGNADGTQGGMPPQGGNANVAQGGMPPQGGNAADGAQGAMMPQGGNAEDGAQGAMMPQGGNADGAQGGLQRPDRGNWGGDGMGMPGGMGGFPGGGMNGNNAAIQNDTAQEALTFGISFVLLALASLVVVFYRRKR